MSATAERVSHYKMLYGTEGVEKFIDAILVIQEHVDPTLIKTYQLYKTHYINMLSKDELSSAPPFKTGYEDLWTLDVNDQDNKSTDSEPKTWHKKTDSIRSRNDIQYL